MLSGQTSRTKIAQSILNSHLFLSKPCPVEYLINTLERVRKIKQILKNKELQTIIANITSLPVFPGTYLKLVKELQSETSSIQNITKIVKQDISVSVKILQVVNSAYFSLPSTISSIEHAVNLLGIQTISSLVLTLGVFSDIENKIFTQFDLQEVWDRAFCAASIVRLLAKHENVDKQTTENAILSSLLFEIGKIVLATQYSEPYYQIFKQYKDDKLSLIKAEKETIGCTYAEIGGYLLGVWGLPFVVVEAITCQHIDIQPDLKTMNCSSLTYLGHLFSYAVLSDLSFYNQELSRLKELNHSVITASRLEQWHDLVIEKFKADKND